MKTLLFSKPWRFCVCILVVLLSLTACSNDTDLQEAQPEDSQTEALARFSAALGVWNAPENFEKEEGQTEADLLANRLTLVQTDARYLLETSGWEKEELKSLSPETAFMEALKIYTNQFKNQY